MKGKLYENIIRIVRVYWSLRPGIKEALIKGTAESVTMVSKPCH